MSVFTDHRTIARERAPWFIESNGDHVVVRVRTSDWHKLADEGWDPSEVPEGVRPTIDEVRAPEHDCERVPYKYRPENIVYHRYFKGWHAYRRLDKPIPDPAFEDRLYVPFRLIAFPCMMVNCPTCDGRGSHVDPAVDAGGLSDDDLDYIGREAYFNGAYDVQCGECRGKRQVPEVSRDLMHPDDQKIWDDHVEWLNELDRDEAEYRAERAAEIRMGC